MPEPTMTVLVITAIVYGFGVIGALTALTNNIIMLSEYDKQKAEFEKNKKMNSTGATSANPKLPSVLADPKLKTKDA